MKRLGVTANCTKKQAARVLGRLSEKARELGISLVADEATACLLKSCEVMSTEKMFDSVEAVLALGGDGTVLRLVRELAGREKPVMGINLGGLGFLTSVAEEDLERALRSIAEGDFTIGARAVMETSVIRGDREIGGFRALNDVVISSGPTSRVVTLDVSIDGENVTSYVCDGLIVSTPTGSTGHSLSAGGPILSPTTPACIISLICPHTLSSRPLVVPDRSEIRVAVARSAGEIVLSVDGQVGQPLSKGDCLRVRRSAKDAHFIHLPGYSYFALLRQKLRWSGSNV